MNGNITSIKAAQLLLNSLQIWIPPYGHIPQSDIDSCEYNERKYGREPSLNRGDEAIGSHQWKNVYQPA